VFADAEIQALQGAARSLDEPFRALTMETLIGLLSCTGLRPMEATNLTCADVQLAEAVLLVRDSKWGVSRMVPLHPTAVAALDRYQHAHRALFHDRRSPGLFMWSTTRRLSSSHASVIFRQLLLRAGIASRPGRRPPRLYDLRHRFAITTLVGWYGQGVDVETALPALSTYMGHLRPKDTYWYLEAIPELLQAATGRLEQFLQDRP
jgi:integrase